MKKLNELALANAVGIVSALTMLLLSGLGGMGLYGNAMQNMMQWHMFYGPSFGGLLGGMIEAFVISFLFTYAVAWLYNQLNKG
ncbi:MAG: hypothetical protein U1C52_00660 [Patescibacteria group bacterium]|nr:hypothetical protein [Patescibacteria group bacterium]